MLVYKIGIPCAPAIGAIDKASDPAPPATTTLLILTPWLAISLAIFTEVSEASYPPRDLTSVTEAIVFTSLITFSLITADPLVINTVLTLSLVS